MAITISGQNNNDKILASDGVLDQISGFNVVGVLTTGSLDVTNFDANHINVGSNIQLGNAGIITATTLIGNVTGNVNHNSNLLLQISGSEKFRVGNGGQLGIGGANYGSSGQVLTSGGSGSAPTWSTISSDKITEGNTEAEVVDTGSDGHFKVTTEGTERLRIKENGVIQFNGTNSADNTNKLVYLTTPSYDTDEEPFGFIHSGTYNNQNLLYLGGGMTSSYNACTLMKFYTTNSINTQVGTERLCIESWGGIQNNQGAIYGGGASNEPVVHFNGAAPSNDLARGHLAVSDNRNYNQSPIARISLVTRYNSAGGYTFMGGIEGGKENTTDGQYGGFVRIVTRPHGGTNLERLRIDSSGRVLIGRTASRMVGGSTTYAKLQVAGTSQSESSISLVNNEQDTKGPFVFFGKTRGNSVGESGIVQNGDTLGGLSFIGADGNDTNNRTAEITAVVNGTPANNTIPTDLVFSTSTQNATQLTEKLRIPSSGSIELAVDGAGIRWPNTQNPSNDDNNRVGISSEMRYYETGTFTPGLSSTVLNSLQNPAFTDNSYARRVGRYVRIGHLVHVTVEIQMAGTVTYAAGVSNSTTPPCITGVTPFYYSYNNRYDVTGQPDYYPCAISYSSSGLTNDTLYAVLRRDFPAQSRIEITKPGSGGSRQYNSTNFGEVFPANAHINVSCTYCIDTSNANY